MAVTMTDAAISLRCMEDVARYAWRETVENPGQRVNGCFGPNKVCGSVRVGGRQRILASPM